MASFAGTGEVEQDFSHLQMANSGRKSRTKAEHLRRESVGGIHNPLLD